MRYFFVGLILASLFIASVANGHQAPSGMHYDPWCCSNNDCAPIDNAMVREGNGGWLVTVPSGEHPTAKGEEIFFPYELLGTDSATSFKKVHVSEDGQFHYCAYYSTMGPSFNRYCLYVPPSGS